MSVIHFDAHLDTWTSYPGSISQQSKVTHGTFFHLAKEEGLMTNTSIHAGIRTKLAVRFHVSRVLKLGLTPSSGNPGPRRHRE